ncbi:uncharacterized protein HD556DRAFT_132544 [Suillus plorans]|uniref:Uncharacterized protein n=1 Tax=Suillus plorans TaxID=116603 RepID=A0A9P7AC33_9AGAM|nr:uncharacterized protein HD556DRAFT_132544 [Suillus plorans]KAG1785427.1 hypothetical protein HD556DRAFT_132544 [Suillus plorans]
MIRVTFFILARVTWSIICSATISFICRLAIVLSTVFCCNIHSLELSFVTSINLSLPRQSHSSPTGLVTLRSVIESLGSCPTPVVAMVRLITDASIDSLVVLDISGRSFRQRYH